MVFQRWVVRVHKWSALLIGLQILIWIGGGFGMALMPLDQVRGEHRMAEPAPLAAPPADLISLMEAAEAAGFAALDRAELVSHLGAPAWLLGSGDEAALVSAGAPVHLIVVDADAARAVASADYEGPGQVGQARWLDRAPWYYGGPVPVWRVEIENDQGRAIFVSPKTGRVVTRRSDTWRLFDVFWRLHIMDYGEGTNINNPLLIGAAAFALVFSLSGLILLVLRVRRTAHRLRRRPPPAPASGSPAPRGA